MNSYPGWEVNETDVGLRLERDGVVLWRGDCLEVLPTLEAESVDLLLTDPPYGIDHQSNRRVVTEKFAKIIGDTDLSFMPALLEETYRVCRPKVHGYVFCRWDKWPLPPSSWRLTNMVVWDKLQHGSGDIDNSFGPRHELIAFITKGRRGFVSERPTDVIQCAKVPPADLVHPHQKPAALLERLIGYSSSDGDVVLDPYAGSGATGIAAIRLNRRFVGCEADPVRFDLCVQRITAALLAEKSSLFPAKPKATQVELFWTPTAPLTAPMTTTDAKEM